MWRVSLSYPSYRALRVTVTSGVARVTTDTPRLNLLDATLMTDLKDFVGHVRDDRPARSPVG